MNRTRAVLLAASVSIGLVPLASETMAASGGAIPDFSGAWAHPSLGFGPPLSGPGPVRNLSRLPSGAGNFDLLAGDYRNPILKPSAAEIVR